MSRFVGDQPDASRPSISYRLRCSANCGACPGAQRSARDAGSSVKRDQSFLMILAPVSMMMLMLSRLVFMIVRLMRWLALRGGIGIRLAVIRQGAHHVAQKFNTTMRPRYSLRLRSFPLRSLSIRLASSPAKAKGDTENINITARIRCFIVIT